MDYKGEKYRALGHYEEFQKLKVTEQKALLMPNLEGYMSVPFVLVEESEEE